MILDFNYLEKSFISYSLVKNHGIYSNSQTFNEKKYFTVF